MTKFSATKRFFINSYDDFKENEVLNISRSFWTNYLEELAMFCVKKTKLNKESCDGGLYVGSLGVAYMVYKVVSAGYCKNYEDELKKYAYDVVQLNKLYLHADKTLRASFILGDCGFYAMASLIEKNFCSRDEECRKFARDYAESAKIGEKKDFLPFGDNELFVGRAGILCGVLFYRKKLGIDVK